MCLSTKKNQYNIIFKIQITIGNLIIIISHIKWVLEIELLHFKYK